MFPAWLNVAHDCVTLSACDPIFANEEFMAQVYSHPYFDVRDTLRAGRTRTIHFPPQIRRGEMVEEGTREEGPYRRTPVYLYYFPSGEIVAAGGGGPSDCDTITLIQRTKSEERSLTIVRCARSGCDAVAVAPPLNHTIYPDLAAIGWHIADGIYHVCPAHADEKEGPL